MKEINEETHLDVSTSEVRIALKHELNFSYRRAKEVPIQSNTVRCLVMRQQYAFKMLELLFKGDRIINVDESWLSQTSYHRKVWAKKGQRASVKNKAVAPRISLIAALDTEGRIFYALTQVTTDQKVMMVFLAYLVQRLDQETPGWRGNTWILLDGARYHTGEEIREFLHKMQLRVIWSAPYSFSTAPIEKCFAGLKQKELN